MQYMTSKTGNINALKMIMQNMLKKCVPDLKGNIKKRNPNVNATGSSVKFDGLPLALTKSHLVFTIQNKWKRGNEESNATLFNKIQVLGRCNSVAPP